MRLAITSYSWQFIITNSRHFTRIATTTTTTTKTTTTATTTAAEAIIRIILIMIIINIYNNDFINNDALSCLFQITIRLTQWLYTFLYRDRNLEQKCLNRIENTFPPIHNSFIIKFTRIIMAKENCFLVPEITFFKCNNI